MEKWGRKIGQFPGRQGWGSDDKFSACCQVGIMTFKAEPSFLL